ncbi:hypothetical protein [Mesorhizobium sp. WSM3224]|uniref:hypothetical protein n=1 Tax=Mesorhizobium sp. WSM3224 TaxID=1040986 RepID=UPI0012EC30EB|nr:hypothetical protein [Mesorhizobium sp. WSM3224]
MSPLRCCLAGGGFTLTSTPSKALEQTRLAASGGSLAVRPRRRRETKGVGRDDASKAYSVWTVGRPGSDEKISVSALAKIATPSLSGQKEYQRESGARRFLARIASRLEAHPEDVRLAHCLKAERWAKAEKHNWRIERDGVEQRPQTDTPVA